MEDSPGGSEPPLDTDLVDFSVDGAQSIELQNFLQRCPKDFECKPCNQYFTTSRDLKKHMNVHKNQSAETEKRIIKNKSQENIEYEESRRNVTNIRFPTERVRCKCVFFAENDHGLKIHQNVHKKEKEKKIKSPNEKDNPVLNKENNLDDFVNIFGFLLSKCREAVPITRIIQKSVRHVVSQDLSNVIEKVILKNDVASWLRLLAFPYIVFRFDGKKENGKNIVRTNLAEFHTITDVSQFLSELIVKNGHKQRNNFSSEEQLMRVVTKKVAEGAVQFEFYVRRR